MSFRSGDWPAHHHGGWGKGLPESHVRAYHRIGAISPWRDQKLRAENMLGRRMLDDHRTQRRQPSRRCPSCSTKPWAMQALRWPQENVLISVAKSWWDWLLEYCHSLVVGHMGKGVPRHAEARLKNFRSTSWLGGYSRKKPHAWPRTYAYKTNAVISFLSSQQAMHALRHSYDL